MARTTRTAHTTKPSLMDRLRNRKTTSTTTTKRSKNPLTGSTTTKTTRTSNGASHHTTGAHHTTGNHHTTGTTTAAPVHHHKRKATMGDKISGAMMKLEGSLTRKPGKKAAGTRRMHGTDGRGSHHTVV